MLRRVLLLVAAGVFAGIGVSVSAGRFIATLLYGFDPTDPVTLAASALVLAAVGVVAGSLPARRASRRAPRRAQAPRYGAT